MTTRQFPRAASARSSTSTWTPSTRPSNNATIRISAASRSPSADPRSGASWRQPAMNTVDRIGLRNAGRFEDGRGNVDDMMELAADASDIVDVTRPGHDHALGGPAEMRRHLLHPLERGIHRPRPRRGKMREGLVRAPERIPEILSLHRHGDAIESGELVRRALKHAFGTRVVVTADVDDQGVVKLSESSTAWMSRPISSSA